MSLNGYRNVQLREEGPYNCASVEIEELRDRGKCALVTCCLPVLQQTVLAWATERVGFVSFRGFSSPSFRNLDIKDPARSTLRKGTVIETQWGAIVLYDLNSERYGRQHASLTYSWPVCDSDD